MIENRDLTPDHDPKLLMCITVFDEYYYDLSLFAFESIEANQAKKNNGINVIIGNPPYSGESANKGKWITDLMEDYKKEPGGKIKLQERNPKWLNDDYVKFIRYAQTYIDKNQNGVLAYICPHGFIDNPTFRGLRWNLLQTYNKIYILNLHGNSNKKEKCPDGSKDENVFDIQQGVCIMIMIKSVEKHSKECCISYFDLFGLRENKYHFLQNSRITDVNFKRIIALEPFYFLSPIDYSIKNIYDSFFSINDLFIMHSVGIVTANDTVLISNTKEKLLKSVFTALSEQEESLCQLIAYRPFDKRYIYYNIKYIERCRDNITMQFINHNNYGLITARSNKSDDCSHFYISDCMSEAKCGERTTQSAIFPLYTYSYDFTVNRNVRTHNLDEHIVNQISKSLCLTYDPNDTGSKTDSFAPIDLLDYIYAIFYSTKYRKKYKDFLKMDFPRVPYPMDRENFWQLVGIGSKLRECHLMLTKFDLSAYSFIGDGTSSVDSPKFKNDRVYINKTQYFDNVPQAQWEQYIGGYQPLQKWLKDRKKTTLSSEDIKHYKKIIAALKCTEELMTEIDKIVIFNDNI